MRIFFTHRYIQGCLVLIAKIIATVKKNAQLRKALLENW